MKQLGDDLRHSGSEVRKARLVLHPDKVTAPVQRSAALFAADPATHKANVDAHMQKLTALWRFIDKATE